MRKRAAQNKNRTLLAAYGLLTAASFGCALLLRYDFRIPAAIVSLVLPAICLNLFVKVLIFRGFRLHLHWSEFVGLEDAFRVYSVNAIASGAFTIMCALIGLKFRISVFFLDYLICSAATAAALFGLRVRKELIRGRQNSPKRILVYGAGAAGIRLGRELRVNRALGYEVAGYLDDDRRKRSAVICGSPVLGAGRAAAEIVENFARARRPIQEIVIAMPSSSPRQLQEALANCRVCGIPCKVLPTIASTLAGTPLTTQIREASLDDLLGRDPVRLEEGKLVASISGKSVLVSGGAGSIGSELCRQLASFRPCRLVIFDQAESDLFRIDMELRNDFPSLEIIPEIGDIRDRVRVDEVIADNAIDVVFHAAAYKHVPMMEANVLEAVSNNVIGTWNLVSSAIEHHVETFLMISSDKAVNPTNIMGATKRLAEIIVSACSGTGTKFVSVRFGNVLGSNGSVVPVFQRQIQMGGPVTVTDPNIRRYFMSIKEAVQLVLQASTMGQGSEIFVLEMGDPVKIIDLACSLIRLAGKIPHEEIEIRIVGLRPGEKLFEELMTESENIEPTYHEKIKIFKGPALAAAEVKAWMSRIETILAERDEALLVQAVAELVPEWKPSMRWRPLVESRVVSGILTGAGQRF